MDRKQKRRWWCLAAILLVGVIVYGTKLTLGALEVLESRDEYDAGERLIGSLMVEPPVNPGDLEWNMAVDHLRGGYGNIFPSLIYKSKAEIKRYRIEFEARIQSGPPRSIENLRWAWNRMGESSQLGRRYIDRNQDDIEEKLSIAERAMRPDSG